MSIVCCREGEPTVDITKIVRSRAYDDRGLPRNIQEKTIKRLETGLKEAQRHYCNALCPHGSCEARMRGHEVVGTQVVTSVLFKYISQE